VPSQSSETDWYRHIGFNGRDIRRAYTSTHLIAVVLERLFAAVTAKTGIDDDFRRVADG
jgi:hypothetical protein